MTDESSTKAGNTLSNCGLIRAFVIVAFAGCILLVFWALRASQVDPYSKAALELVGSQKNGSKLFKINCAGCHGIEAQGLVGPNLREVTSHYRDRKLIQQIVSGQTPPMPSFEMEPQAMADILSYLHSLS